VSQALAEEQAVEQHRAWRRVPDSYSPSDRVVTHHLSEERYLLLLEMWVWVGSRRFPVVESDKPRQKIAVARISDE